MASLRCFMQKTQLFDILLGVKAPVVASANWINDSVPFLPHADGVDGQTGFARYNFDRPNRWHALP